MSNLLESSQRAVEQPVKEKKFLHYADKRAPYRPALCGVSALARGWWSDVLSEAQAVVDAWEVCPRCEAVFEFLPSQGGRK